MVYLLQHCLDHSAERYPDHDVMRCQGQSLTYSELVQRSNALAHALIELGVQRRDRVGIYLNKGLETAIAIYGIWKAGAAYVPLDPLAPSARLSYMIADCGIRHLVSHSNKLETLGQIVAACPAIEAIVGLKNSADLALHGVSWDTISTSRNLDSPKIQLMESDLAYIMYTSGSTGHPKGMMHTHASGLAYAKMALKTYDVGHADRLSNHSPLHFVMSTFDYFVGPLAGATTIIIPEAYTKLPASLSKLIADERMTIWYSVPFALIQLLLRGVLETRDLSALRWILFGGEPFSPAHLRALQRLLPQAQFSNVYGPAEVNQCSYYHVPPLTDSDDLPIPIGVIWDNAEGLIVDEHDQELAAGEIGELFVRTPTMMRGYWGRPDLNERAFYRRTVFPNYEDIFYRTGDLVQQDADGNLKFLGRMDRQIKTRGYRVELDEVENALSTHPQVEENAVYAVPDHEGSSRIEAAVIARRDAELHMDQLIQYLIQLLPWYALPRSILILEEFPRTGSGKIDRRALTERALEGRT